MKYYTKQIYVKRELNILKSSQIAKINYCRISGKQKHENMIMNLDSFLNALSSLYFKETRIR